MKRYAATHLGVATKLLLVAVLLIGLAATALSDEVSSNSTAAEPFDFGQPALLTGTIYAIGSDHKKILFTFRRSATRFGSTVRVGRKYLLPDGSLAASENIVYESGRLASYDMKELQAATWGSIQIRPDAKNSARQKITVNHGREADRKKGGTTDDLSKDTQIDDTIYPFMLAHWDDLTQGKDAKFRFVSLEWEKTFGFKLTQSGESVVNGKPVIVIRMDATSLIVSRLMAPLFFSVEKAAPHRVIEYIGRTTPKIKSGNSWKYLDADTVFNWQ